MTQEEKAKAYDKAIEIAKDYYKANLRLDNVDENLVLEDLFPKLNESEDERIRKEITGILRNAYWTSNRYRFIELVDWLENQGEQKSANKVEPKFNIGDTIVEKDFDECGYGTIKDIKDGQYIFTDGSGMNINEQNGWQLVKTSTNIKQKPAWSEEDEYRADAIAEIKDESQKELAETYLTVFDKKFPILPTLRGKQLADYKNFLNKCQQIFGLKYWGTRPLQAKLFEKLSLLWAAWGAEHLQGLGQTGDRDNEISMWSEECKEAFSDICENCCGRTVELVKNIMQPKQEWSEEDEDAIGQAIVALEDMYEEDNPRSCYAGYKLPFIDAAERLKSIRDRIHPQNK